MLTITKSKLQELINKIKDDFEVLDCRNNRLSFKQYFLPAEQVTLKEDARGSIFESTSPKKFVLIGLGLKDLDALAMLDEIMTKPVGDFFYHQKRNKSVVIGLTDKQITGKPGGDIVLQFCERKMPDVSSYRVWVSTEKGHNFIKRYRKFFEESLNEPAENAQNKILSSWGRSMDDLLLNPELLADAVEWSRTGAPQIWEELEKKCLGCGVCTYVCPLCFCFYTEDSVHLDGNCSRCRKWDACTLPRFAQISGGFNFRKTIKERYYNWFYHKFARNYREHGQSLCVGCGRCKLNCPAKIDILEELNKILEAYKKND